MKHIDSETNPIVKTLRRLAHPRKREPVFLLEGRKLVDAAILAGTELQTIVVSTSFQGQNDTSELEAVEPGAVRLVELSDTLFRQLSTLESPEGILAIAQRPESRFPTSGIVAVAAGIQDPGNLGAIARIVEASGATALIVLKGSADPFGPKAVRGSMGAVLRVPVCETPDLSPLDGFTQAALVPRGGVDYRTVRWSSPLAIIFGAESTGLPANALSNCDLHVTIPMKGAIESLNVATAAALVLYEAARPTTEPQSHGDLTKNPTKSS